MAETSERFSLKDHLFNRERVAYLAKLFQDADPAFNAAAFRREVMKSLKELELKERIVHIATTLSGHLEDDFAKASNQILAALPEPLDPTRTDDDFGDFIFAALGEYVVRNGMAKQNVSRSLKTLREITKRFSMEDAIRYFIREYPDRTMKELEKWACDKNYHVRRLVSEGTRPSLPWSGKIGLAPQQTLPLLDQLHSDPTRYVTRSVANHLNDLSKTNPSLVVSTLRGWQAEGKQAEDELAWMTRHALRTLVKQGNEEALKLLGFRANPKVQVNRFVLHQTTVRPGEAIAFEVGILADRAEKLIVDYVIDFVKSNGRTAPKVFKLSQLELSKGELRSIKKRHPFRANATTFTLYPGTHKLSLQLNGKVVASKDFEMLDA